MSTCNRCKFFLVPPFHQCPKGHSLCNNCIQEASYMQSVSAYSLRERQTENYKPVTKMQGYCSQCDNFYFQDEERRDLELENTAKFNKYSCIYQENGCQFSDSYPSIESHTETCLFNVKKCFWKDCNWESTLMNMKNHFILDHHTLEIKAEESFQDNRVYTIFCRDDFFILKTLLAQNEIKFMIIYIGQPNKYVFELNLGSKYKYNVKFRRIIEHMKNCRNSEFNFANSESFELNLNFLRQYIGGPEDDKIEGRVFFKVEVSELNNVTDAIQVSETQKRKINIHCGELCKYTIGNN